MALFWPPEAKNDPLTPPQTPLGGSQTPPRGGSTPPLQGGVTPPLQGGVFLRLPKVLILDFPLGFSGFPDPPREIFEISRIFRVFGLFLCLFA